MTSGGARVRSGPAHDPKSARSESRGLTTMAVLPASGYGGRIPGLNRYLPKPTRQHREVWERLWRTPQACVWIREPWRHPVVAELARLEVMTLDPEGCAVGIWQAIRQRRDDLGLSTAGRRLEGWEIPSGVAYAPAAEERPAPAGDELGERRKRRSSTLHEE
jgi:hypothetical protein